MSGIALRPARLADCTAMAGIHARARGAYYRGHIPDQELAAYARTPPTRYREIMTRATMTVRCAEQDGTVVGVTVTGPEDEPAAGQTRIARLYQIQVEPACWRHGIGSRLMAACVRGLAGSRNRPGPAGRLGAQHPGPHVLRPARLAARWPPPHRPG
jgi:ribosomal protein S18 acetylase RimI-like enzyme